MGAKPSERVARFTEALIQAVREEVRRYSEVLGVEHLTLRAEWPGLLHCEALKNLIASRTLSVVYEY